MDARTPGSAQTPRLHYAWVIVATGTLCIVACLGFGRFTLGMLLPSMARSLGLSYSRLGYIGTGNFVGYLAAVLVCGPIAARIGPRLLIFLALLLVGGSMFLVSRSSSFPTLLVLYTLTGVGSGATNVPVMGLIARWFRSSLRGRAAGIASAGSGLAIVASGRFVPFVNEVRGPEGWRTSWLVLAVAVTIIAVVSLVLFRNDPAEKHTTPLGSDPPRAPAHPAAARRDPRFHRSAAVYLLGVIYAIFGYTYAIYVTFIVTFLVRERGFSEGTAGAFWSVVGFLSLFSGPAFGSLSDRLGRRAGLMAAFSTFSLAYVLAGAGLPQVALYASVACFGITAWAVPSIMVAAVSDQVGAPHALAAFGFVTFFFGLGQIAGPAVAGNLAERTASFSSSFLMAGAFAAIAIAVSAIFLKPTPAAR